jgi:hypothetical protein
VPTDSSLIVLEFDLYNNDDLASGDEVYLRINDVYLDLISYTGGAGDGTKMGTFGKFPATMQTSGNTHHIELTIPGPDTNYPDGRLQVGFKIATSSASDSVGFDNIELTSACAIALPTEEVTCSLDHTEDFENGEAFTWVNGLEASDSAGDFTTFLGRLGRENPGVSKTFVVPSVADKIVVDFDYYSIDGHEDSDKVYVNVQGEYLDLNLFESSTGTTTVLFNDITVTIVKRASRNMGFSSATDEQFTIKVEIPKNWYPKGELEIGFRVDMRKSIYFNGGGIDNFGIAAECPDSKVGDRRAEEKNLPALEPSSDAEDGSFYCTSEDFPCEDGSKTHVCHYSSRRGYQTFCIPEADSEILRFYSNDYCGPCVGGYGGADTA